ncbi:MAG: hypothetical protein HYS86_02695 [Candidatus Chisholmbacteria bacterium]|nr:hypothetical protein [Candidatus Chisholmbacteria bacterium]
MKKEVILAIVIGFAIGLLITFGIYTARTALENAPQNPSPQPSASPENSTQAGLIITTPANEALVDTATIPLEGTATPEAIITIITPEGQQIITADSEGNFATEIELAGGANEIQISAFTPEGLKTEVSLTVVYSTAEI